jgi:hypothetical protein
LRRLGSFDVTDGICFWGNRKISKKMRDPKFKERQGNGTNLTRGLEAGRSVLDRRRINACPMIESMMDMTCNSYAASAGAA